MILKEDVQHIFEPFFRSETTRLEKGHGIGLFLTKKIILLHNAKVTVISDHNETIFTVEFMIS
jgi:signal transduction histidine kinase